ncbi:neuropilin and tolloid-like protein 2 [Amyelois transitella]|uniref:neuropilin and tolloid-like protein 2 n=1 Tax=Amyelois transitella TaxID=680683 RepID=UPI00298F8AA5|nr:neuropilin and tolloid-like protein 2 [Amyelois transitella]
MTAPVFVLLSLAFICTKAGATDVTADYGTYNTHINTNNNTKARTNSVKDKVNFVTPTMVALDKGNNLRVFNETTLRGFNRKFNDTSLTVNRRVKRNGDDDRCAAFKFVDNDQVDIWHPHPKDNPSNSNYYRKIDCVTVINGSEGTILELTFVDIFRIEDHPDCDYDYLEIRDGLRGYAPLLGGKKICGQQFPRPIHTTGPYAWLKFHSDDTIEYEGFHIKIAVKPVSKNHVIPESCHFMLSGTDGILDIKTIEQKCKDDSENQELDVLWTIEAEPNHKIYLNFTLFELAKPNACEDNVVQVFGSVIEFDAKLAHYCGSIANSVTTKTDTTKTPNDEGNVMHVRLYASKSAKDETKFTAHYTVFRTLDSTNENDKCDEDEEFDCQDSTCIAADLKCNSYANCRLKADEEADLCKGETESIISQTHILVILVIFSLILSGMTFVFLFKCIRKLYQDHKLIKAHIQQSCEDGLDNLAKRRLTLDAMSLERDSEPRASLERENHTNEMVKKQRSFSKHKQSSIDESDFIQETHLDLDDEPWRRDVNSVPDADNVKVERNGRTRRSDFSKKEESIRKRDSEERRDERKDKREIRDASVGAPDTKESGCQTRESLFQTDPPPSSDGSGSNSRGFSTFGYSGATIARPSPPPQTATSEITIELLSQVTPQAPSKTLKKIPDRRPMSTETTRSAPDVIIVSKPIR